MNLDVERLTEGELDALLAAAERRKRTLAKRRPIGVVRAELEAKVAAWGYTIDELLASSPANEPTPAKPRARRKAGKVAAKYQDPQNRRNTWSGRGSMPRWLADRVKRGQPAADFLIPGLAKPTPKRSAVGKRSVFKTA